MPKVSIIIRAKNEERYIGRVMEKVFSQDFKDFEVIVIDSGSTDRTVEIAKGFDIRLLEIPPQEFSYGYALNLGARTAEGKIIVNLSAHAAPANNKWLENLIAPLRRHDVAGVYGRQIPDAGSSPIEKRDLFESYMGLRKIQTKDITFSNSNSAVKKSVLRRFPFDEAMSFAEDIDWSRKILGNGYKIAYEPTAGVYHSHEHNLKQIYQRELNRHRGRLQRNQYFKFRTLVKLFLKGIKDDIRFCIVNTENPRWIFYIPVYNLTLFFGRCVVEARAYASNLRRQLKKVKLLRRPYNYVVYAYRYRKEFVRYKWDLVKDSANDRCRVKDILLIRTFGMGDIIRTTPIIEKLKKKFYNARIHYFTYKKHLPIVFYNPNIHRIYTEGEIADVLERRFDVVINWQIFDNCEYTKRLMKGIKAEMILGRKFNESGGYYYDTTLNLKTWMEEFCRIARVPYDKHDPEKVKIHLPGPSDKKRKDLKRFGIADRKKYIGICLGGDEVSRPQYWYRNYSVEFLEQMVKRLSKRYNVIIVGQTKDRTKDERKKIHKWRKYRRVVNLIDKLKLEELIAVIKRCDCFISPDTGAVHMAMALKVPLVALFSNNTGGAVISPKRRGRCYSALYNDRPSCFPCEQMFEKECLGKRRAECIERIPVRDVVKEVDKWIIP